MTVAVMVRAFGSVDHGALAQGQPCTPHGPLEGFRLGCRHKHQTELTHFSIKTEMLTLCGYVPAHHEEYLFLASQASAY